MKFINSIKMYRASLRENHVKRNRFYLLLVTTLIIADYLMICFHVERNPFAIFPPLPVMDKRESFTIYLPDTDGKSLLKETRLLQKDESENSFITTLVHNIAAGSQFENTRITVPIDCHVRTVWITNGTCIVDLRMTNLDPSVPVIPGSEANFKKAVKKTILENVTSVKDIIIVENGIFNRDIWELSQFDEDGEI